MLPSRAWTFPLYAQVLLAVLCGATLGAVFGQHPYLGGLRNEHLGQLGMLVIAMLKMLAIPLIFFAILDAFLRTNIALHQGTRLLVICLVNVSVAMMIGLLLMNTWKPGHTWYGHVEELLNLLPDSEASGSDRVPFSPSGLLGPTARIAGFTFFTNNVIAVVLLAVVVGVVLRRRGSRAGSEKVVVGTLAQAIEGIYHLLGHLLQWRSPGSSARSRRTSTSARGPTPS